MKLSGPEAERHAQRHMHRIYVRTDQLFAVLMFFQFVAAVAAAYFISPRTWSGMESSVHIHLYAAIGIGFLLAAFPIFLVFRSPGAKINQYVISASQLMFSGLLIHLTGGRIETHFHVFGSLAFIAFYRDWKVLMPATIVTAVDHLARAVYFPESIFGVLTAAPWRAIEHAGWVVFENIFLIYSCVIGTREVRMIAERRAELEKTNETIEHKVDERTQELQVAIDALNKEIADRQKLEGRLLEAQKLESIGQLAAGIAHEINTPAQYVGDNTRFLQSEFEGILKVIDRYAEQLNTDGPKLSWAERSTQIQETLDTVDYEFIREEIPQAIKQSLEGIERITGIVKAMKDFSHPGAESTEPADLNNAIQSTAMVCSNRWKYAAEIEFDLDAELGPVPCFLAEFNQVILNLIVNAADAIEELNRESGAKGNIVVSTK
jgi:signal transduction histidine kinase